MNRLMAIMTIFGLLCAVFGIVYFLILKKKWKLVSENAVLLALIVSLSASIGSLIYSNYIGFEPCNLCWYQRIFIFSQVVLFAVALYIKDKKHIAAYSLTFSGVGILISTYHYYLQLGGKAFTECSALSQGTSCAARTVWEFGFVSIPLMAWTVFLMLITLMLIHKQYENR